MKRFTISCVALPIFSIALLWGVSMVATPVNSTTLNGLSAIQLAAAYSPQSTRTPTQSNNIRGTVVRFLEGSELIIDDGNGRLFVEYQNKWKPLNLRVGDRITISGEMQGSGDSREIDAEEIMTSRGVVYPQPSPYSSTRTNQAPRRNQISMADAEALSQTQMVSDILLNSSEGDMVLLEGSIMEMPADNTIILGDDSGTMLIDVDDAGETLDLQKGDDLSITGKVIPGSNGKKELQAMSIEKKN